MIDFKDRQPTRAGRRKLIHEDGTSEFVTVEMADEPTVMGTPLNRGTYMDLQGYGADNTTITENENVTTVTTTYPDGGKKVTTITVVSDILTTVVMVYTGADGGTVTKTINIDTSTDTIQIGGIVV